MESTDINQGSFVKLPMEIILLSKDFQYIIPIYNYLYIRRGLDDVIETSYKFILKYMGKRHVRKNTLGIESCKISLEWLISNKYFILIGDSNLDNSNVDNPIYLKANPDMIDNIAKYAHIYTSESNRLLQLQPSKSSYASTYILFKLLSYIRINISLRSVSQNNNNPSNKPQMYYSSIKTIAQALSINPRTVVRTMAIFNDLGIIYSDTLPKYQDSYGNWHTDVTIFVNKYLPDMSRNYKVYGYKLEMKWAKEKLKEKKNEHSKNQNKQSTKVPVSEI